MLTDEQLVRYGRQILLHDFDVAGQEKLLASTVMVVGLGGLGTSRVTSSITWWTVSSG